MRGPMLSCYFHGTNLHHEKLAVNKGLISFAVPDYGVIFRAQHEGNRYECEYAAGIALIRFMQVNQSHFQGKGIKLLTDSPIVVYQVNNKISATQSLLRLRDLLLFYKRKLGFELTWIPTKMNRAEMGLDEIAVNRNALKFNFDIFDESTRRKDLTRPGNKQAIRIT